ncbi:MAG: exodeoxyribonuclease V subunit gamma [Chlorobiaceae bacterium]
MALNLFTSNRMEALVDKLGKTLCKPLASPFTKEIIVVQSRGMQRWLSMTLASHFGIWANCHYPFPNAMVTELFTTLFSPFPDSDFFDSEVMTWNIMQLLPELLASEFFSTPRHYLSDDHDGLKLFQLSEKIAYTFDQYTIYRPDMLAEWENEKLRAGKDDWQAILWLKLISANKGVHRGKLKEQFCQKLKHFPPRVTFPERITLFGISYLPEYHLDLFSAVSAVTEVNMFLLSPTREYWGDIISKKASSRLSPQERIFRSEGNPLLASLGTVGRDFSDMILNLSETTYAQEDLYEEPGELTLLHSIQSDILNLSGSGDNGVNRNLDPGDRSVQIHSCHSPLREIEVLYDNILSMFEKQSDLTPRDIVVMALDIESYSPYISSVFSRGVSGFAPLPYSIADRRMMNEGEIAAAVLKVLDLHGSRLGASELFDLIASPPVRRRFSINEEELAIIRGWIEKIRIRWGMDERDRTLRGLPSYRENSWRAGLDRLLLGYAMQDENELFKGILPFDDVAGSAAEMLGRFSEFINTVDTFVQTLDYPRSLRGWQRHFQDLIKAFILPADNSEREYAAIVALAEKIGNIAGITGHSGDVGSVVMLSWLRARLEQHEQGLGFMTGGITFCAMLPMRSIPFKVVALIGMNDSAFPRQSRSPGFDLIALYPRRGDRSLRNEDRYLFLESILSARDLLYISYVGQSIKDNSDIPPSVLVSELLDAVRRTFCLSSGASVEKQLVVKHRLQAFNGEYFTEGSSLFSYSIENYRACLAKESGVNGSQSFMSAPLAELSEEWKTVPLTMLLRFYDNPARFFLEHRLGIRFEGTVQPLNDRESFYLQGLEQYIIKQELLEAILREQNVEVMLPLFRSRGLLPPARHGKCLFIEMVTEVKEFAWKIKQKTGSGGLLEPLEIDLRLGEFRLTGKLDRLWPKQQLHYRCAKIKPQDRMRSWIEHLVLNTEQRTGYPEETLLLMVDDAKRFTVVHDSSMHLEKLLQHYWRGLMMPLPFFLRSSLAYAEKDEESEKLKAARKEWMDNGFTNHLGEGSDPAIHLCFGSSDPFNEAFKSLTDEILIPMMQSERKAE